MDNSEIGHRNQIIRAYFNGRDWDKNNKYALKRQLVLSSHQLLLNHPYVVEDEWEVEPGRTDKGRGDLVFTDGTECFAVVEVKWIDLEGLGRTGSTKRTSNRKKRRAVEEQAINYANIYTDLVLRELNTVKRVEAFVFTNEYAKPCLLQSKEFWLFRSDHATLKLEKLKTPSYQCLQALSPAKRTLKTYFFAKSLA